MTLRLSSQRDRTPKSLGNKIQLPSSSSSSPFKLSSRWHFGRFYFRFHLAFTILFLIIISVIKVKRFRFSFCIGLFSGQRGSCPNMICWWLRVNRFFFSFSFINLFELFQTWSACEQLLFVVLVTLPPNVGFHHSPTHGLTVNMKCKIDANAVDCSLYTVRIHSILYRSHCYAINPPHCTGHWKNPPSSFTNNMEKSQLPPSCPDFILTQYQYW